MVNHNSAEDFFFLQTEPISNRLIKFEVQNFTSSSYQVNDYFLSSFAEEKEFDLDWRHNWQKYQHFLYAVHYHFSEQFSEKYNKIFSTSVGLQDLNSLFYFYQLDQGIGDWKMMSKSYLNWLCNIFDWISQHTQHKKVPTIFYKIADIFPFKNFQVLDLDLSRYNFMLLNSMNFLINVSERSTVPLGSINSTNFQENSHLIIILDNEDRVQYTLLYRKENPMIWCYDYFFTSGAFNHSHFKNVYEQIANFYGFNKLNSIMQL